MNLPPTSNLDVSMFVARKSMKFFIKGNASVIDQKAQIGKIRAQASHFREIGIGAAYPSPNANVVIGARLKYLQGFVNASSPENQVEPLPLFQTLLAEGQHENVRNFLSRGSGTV